ncbi:hypothetical protein [Geomicrobium sp. JCM 19039]|uniref:hypothetical protein n=1 Tax=Geomicrobium sp. JCM 19039 TaxID=1460636 RepID=UPI00045F4317|nr:hypothetical protein [Geomicrobium sp. JCM 19039]GAK12238.1 hypothetical protein JCM19039_1993 [Geomicrobium sp. JCM 19039]
MSKDPHLKVLQSIDNQLKGMNKELQTIRKQGEKRGGNTSINQTFHRSLKEPQTEVPKDATKSLVNEHGGM